MGRLAFKMEAKSLIAGACDSDGIRGNRICVSLARESQVFLQSCSFSDPSLVATACRCTPDSEAAGQRTSRRCEGISGTLRRRF